MKKLKIIFVILSVVMVITLLPQKILISNSGSVSLSLFESTYFYIILIVIALLMINKNKNTSANIFIVLALLTYLYTSYLVYQMFELIKDVKMYISINFYIYLSSSIFLIIALFFNNKPKSKNNNISNNKIKDNVTNENNNISNNLNNDTINDNYFLFAYKILGSKDIPYNTFVLLINDYTNNNLNITYEINNNKKTDVISLDKIKDIYYESKVKMNNTTKKVESNDVKSQLLSAAMFGGAPLLQMAGGQVFNELLSNNYDKVKLNLYYELTINVLSAENELQKMMFVVEHNPEAFINLIKKR